MYQNVNFNDFVDAFSEDRKDTFSYEGKKALFDYLEQYEEGTGEKIELDIIALCCEYAEYESAWDVMHEYQPEDMPNETEALRWLQEHTQVIEFDKGIIIQQF